MTEAGTRDRLDADVMFVVGCPRSGTTWLQLLLGCHPAVSTVNETHLFSQFLGPSLETWDSLAGSDRDIGLGTVFTRREFVDRLRCLAREVMARIARDDTRLIVEKTPGHAVWGEEILQVFPNALFVHLVRDPRDVVASMLAANRSWGDDWAPESAYDAAWWWRDVVAGGRSIGNLTDDYCELTYEDLWSDTAGEFSRLLRWTGLDAPESFVREAVEETRLSRMKEGESAAPWDLRDEPEGFVRKGGPGNWRDDLSASEAGVVEYVTRELMSDLGYEPERRRRSPPLGMIPHWIRDRILELLE